MAQTQVEITPGASGSAPSETYKFSTYEQLQVFLKAKGWENDQVWELFRGTGVPKRFSEISLTEEQLTDLASRLQGYKSRFEQQSLLRAVVRNKLREEIDSITFADPNEVCEALKQRGVEYPYEYLSGDPANSSFISSFKGPRTLARTQYEKLIVDLNAISGTDALSIGKRGEMIRKAFLGTPSTLAGSPSGVESLGKVQVLVDEYYPSREEASKKALETAENFPVLVKYSQAGKSYEYDISTSGSKMNFGGKEVIFSHKGTPVGAIKIEGNDIVFSDVNGKALFTVNKSTFANNVLVELIRNTAPNLELFGKESGITLALSGAQKGKSIPTPQVQKELSGEELKEYIMQMAKQEMEKIGENTEKLTPGELDGKIEAMLSLLNYKWLEKVPGMKDKIREVMKMDIALEGVIGTGFLTMLEKHGYKIWFTGKNKVAAGHATGSPDTRDIETKLNMHLSNNPAFSRLIQVGMIYRQPSFEAYRKSVTNSEGALINPEKTTLAGFLQYASKQGGAKPTLNEMLFARSASYFDKSIPFASIVNQGNDFNRIRSMMTSMNSDEEIRRMLGGNGTGGNGPRAAMPPARAEGAAETGESSTAVGVVGQGLGTIGGVIGKLGEAGIGGGMKVLGDIFREASKTGGGYGTLAVIALIGYSIFGKKGLGFWGTIGAILGLGVADTAARGGFKGLFSANTPGTPSNGGPAAPGAPAAAAAPPRSEPGARPGSQVEIVPPTVPQNKPLTERSLIARAVGKESIHDADVDIEQTTINAVSTMNLVKLQNALSKGDESSWQAAVDSSGFVKGSNEYNELARVINKENTAGRKILTSVVGHVVNNDFIKKLDPANRAGLTLAQAMEFIIKKENEIAEEGTNGTFQVEQGEGAGPIPSGHPSIKEVFEKNEQYGSLVVLARMVEYGYLPKINYTVGEVVGSSSGLKKILKGAVWVGLGGPITNNVPGANWFSGKYRVHEENFYKSVAGLINEERALIQKTLPTLPDDAIFTSLKQETEVRKKALTDLEAALATKDASKIKSALANYREVAKTPFHKGRLDTGKFAEAERKSITAIDEVNARIEGEFKIWKEAQDIANSPNASPEQRKAATEATAKYNQSVMELEAHGVKYLQQLSPESREVVTKENAWAKKVATANGGFTKLNTLLGKAGTHWAGKTVLGVGVIGLLWESKGGINDLWKKGDYVTLSKMGFDVVAGAIPLVSSLHETAMLSNALGYRDFLLGKGYEMNTLEKGFRVAGAIPLGTGIAGLGGKLAIKAGARGTGQAVLGNSEIIGNSVKTVGTVGTYGYLGYQASQVVYNIPLHLIDKQ